MLAMVSCAGGSMTSLGGPGCGKGERCQGNLVIHTALAVAYFFSVATIPPLRCAALSALLPLTTVSRGPAAPPRVRAPILVTLSQSSLIVFLVESLD